MIGENSVNLHVVQPLKAECVELNVMAARGALRSACGRLAKLHNVLSPVHIVPRIANTIRAYPPMTCSRSWPRYTRARWPSSLARRKTGTSWRRWWTATSASSPQHLSGRGVVARHYAKLHPVFDGLPSRDLMQQPYQNVLPLHSFESETDEEMSGSIAPSPPMARRRAATGGARTSSCAAWVAVAWYSPTFAFWKTWGMIRWLIASSSTC